MSTSLFSTKSLGKWDKATISIYITLSILLAYSYKDGNDNGLPGMLIFGYAIFTHMFLYLYNYISLRNFKVYTIWLIISIFHFVAYLYLKSDVTLQYENGHAAIGLRNTIILLILIQILRYLSLVTQGQELVAPSRKNKDIFNERIVSPVDVLLFLAYFIIAGFLTFVV